MKHVRLVLTIPEALLSEYPEVRAAAQSKINWFKNVRPHKTPDDLMTRIYPFKINPNLLEVLKSTYSGTHNINYLQHPFFEIIKQQNGE